MQSRLIATATPTCDLGIAVADTFSLHRVVYCGTRKMFDEVYIP